MDGENARNQSAFRLNSVALTHGQPIPDRYACAGEGHLGSSPDLGWTVPPEGTKALAVTVIDDSADGFVHWAVLDIPPSSHGLKAGARGKLLPQGSFELENDFGSLGYGGPCPPEDDDAHLYLFSVHALGGRVSGFRPGDKAGRGLEKRLRSDALASATLSATYER